MDPRDALNKIIVEYKLKPADLCRASNIHAAEFSRYRNGYKDMNVTTFFRLVYAMPIQARVHFLSLCGFSEKSDELVAAS